MRIRVNGEEREAAEGLSIAGLLGDLEMDAVGIAVALNMEIVRRAEYAEAKLSEGDEVEIVRAVGGG